MILNFVGFIGNISIFFNNFDIFNKVILNERFGGESSIQQACILFVILYEHGLVCVIELESN